MPTIVILDVSFSMCLPVKVPDSTETFTSLQFAVLGINSLLDYLASNFKLEFVALMTFSSSCSVVSSFTRDFDLLKERLAEQEEQDGWRLGPVLEGVNQLVLEEWGNATPCQVILVTNGASQRQFELEALSQSDSPLPFAFPGKLTIVVVAQPGPPNPVLSQVAKMSGADGSVIQLQSDLTHESVTTLFQKMAAKNYASFCATLKCGNLSSSVILSPPPMPYSETYSVGTEVAVCGFLDLHHVGSPKAVSRHLLLSTPPPDTADDNSDAARKPAKTPSFCVLLHGSLKTENMAALCQVAPEWFGLLYSWADTKKKSNLMLALLEPGNTPVPWLGDLRQLDLPDPDNLDAEESFPIRSSNTPSYSQNIVSWIKPYGLQTDIQKILRHARKLPEKTVFFYKELNRVRKAAISLGFLSLLVGLAAILELECTLLPGGTHPDCALQLTHAANVLRMPCSLDPNYNIMPLPTCFQETNSFYM